MKSPLYIVSFVLFYLLFCATPSFAHDFWIEPSTYNPAVEEMVKFYLKVGEHFKGELVSRNPKLLKRFTLSTKDGERDIPGILHSVNPAGFQRIKSPGLHVVGYRSNQSKHDTSSDAFDAYLKEEGLEAILETRRKNGDQGKPVKEFFSRCAKALLVAEDSESFEGFDRKLGFRLELVPTTNPYDVTQKQQFQLLYLGKPVSDVLVVAVPRSNPEKNQRARTDSDGAVSFSLAKGEEWLIKAVHMVETEKGSWADWESFWASLTFQIS